MGPTYRALSKAIVLAGAVAGSLALYFFLSLYVFPQSYMVGPRRPEAFVTVNMSASEVKLGESFAISATGTNRGEEADMELVSLGFPNLTRTDYIKVLRHDFLQSPVLINAGEKVGSEYSGNERLMNAKYASVEGFSRPWQASSTYSIKLEVKPEKEGTFVVFVKSIAFPHSWDGAHWPQKGVIDYQKEFVEVYDVKVTKP